MLDKNTMTTICSQNTSFHKSVLPCYYYVREGNGVRRLDDIWQGFFAKKCIDAMNENVTVGKPLTYHERHIHNLLNDLMGETVGIIMNERLIEFLDKTELSSKTYSDNYLELASCLEKALLGSNRYELKYWLDTARRMRVWVDVCEAII
jgi:hypothetical protein